MQQCMRRMLMPGVLCMRTAAPCSTDCLRQGHCIRRGMRAYGTPEMAVAVADIAAAVSAGRDSRHAGARRGDSGLWSFHSGCCLTYFLCRPQFFLIKSRLRENVPAWSMSCFIKSASLAVVVWIIPRCFRMPATCTFPHHGESLPARCAKVRWKGFRSFCWLGMGENTPYLPHRSIIAPNHSCSQRCRMFLHSGQHGGWLAERGHQCGVIWSCGSVH